MLVQSSETKTCGGAAATYKELIWDVLRWKPGMDGMSASEMYHHLRSNGWPVKLSSLSGQLTRMTRAGDLRTLPGFGPRGGKGYVLEDE